MEKLIEEMNKEIETAKKVAEQHKDNRAGSYWQGQYDALFRWKGKLKNFIGFNVPVSGNEANSKIKQSGEVAV